MPSPEDTKVCPYCAEVIRAAAIKCRYCQSDLTDITSAPLSSPAPPVDPVDTVDPVDPDDRVDPVPSGPRRRPWELVLVTVAAALTVLFLTLAFLDWRAGREIAESEDAARTVRASVADKVTALLSYDHATFDSDLEAAKEGMTANFEEEYEPTVEEIRDRALAQQRSQVAEVVAVAVVSQSPDEVEALVFVNTIASRAGTDAQRLMQNRVSVTLVEQDDTWLIDELSVPQA